MWVPVNTQVQQTTPFQVSTTEVFLQDRRSISLDELTELSDNSIFKFEQKPMKPYEKDEIVQMDITIEMNLNQLVIARDIYTFLDFLSDIGGIQGMLISGVALFMAFWNYNMLENYMVSKLYKLKPSHKD